MAQIDTASVLLADTTLGKHDKIKLRVEIYWDEQTQAHRMKVTDERSDVDATRAIRAGEDKDFRINMQQAVNVLPEMIEEIIVLNKLMGGV